MSSTIILPSQHGRQGWKRFGTDGSQISFLISYLPLYGGWQERLVFL